MNALNKKITKGTLVEVEGFYGLLEVRSAFDDGVFLEKIEGFFPKDKVLGFTNGETNFENHPFVQD